MQCPFYFRLNTHYSAVEEQMVFVCKLEMLLDLQNQSSNYRIKWPKKKNPDLVSLSFLWFGWGVPTVGIVVSGGQQHSEEHQQWHQQVGNIDRKQQQAFLQRLGTSSWHHWELMKHDVAQDGHQRGGHVNRIHNGRHPNPLTAACEMTWSVKRLKYVLFYLDPVAKVAVISFCSNKGGKNKFGSLHQDIQKSHTHWHERGRLLSNLHRSPFSRDLNICPNVMINSSELKCLTQVVRRMQF